MTKFAKALHYFKSTTVTTGLAMFAMFFGAGNVVFPLAVGQYAQDGNIYAIMGLLITAVGVPFLGLMSMTLFRGDYQEFFGRVGKIPGYLIAAAIIILIGPLGALPRTIALAFSTTRMFIPELSLPWFSALSCLLIFMLTIRKNRIVDIIGKFLTPLLLGSLAVIIIKGLFTGHPAQASPHEPLETFFYGLSEGYKTMDLLGAFFFSSVIISSLQKAAREEHDRSKFALVKMTLKASIIGASLLAVVYCGFSYLAANWADHLSMTSPEYFLGSLALATLGPYAGIVACVAVAMACLTTAIALAAVSSEFIHYDILRDKISYSFSLVVTIVITFLISILDFTGIMEFLAPILEICYPALILLSFLNLAYKLWGFKMVKTPTACLFILSLWTSLG